MTKTNEMTLKSTQDFIIEIEKLVKTKKINYLDALMFYVEKHNIEPEVIASIVKKNPNLKSKLQENCTDLNLMVQKRVV